MRATINIIRLITIERFHSRVQHLRMQIIGTRESVSIKKQVELPKDWFGTLTWPP